MKVYYIVASYLQLDRKREDGDVQGDNTSFFGIEIKGRTNAW